MTPTTTTWGNVVKESEIREIRERLLADELEILTQLERQLQGHRKSREPLSKEFVDMFAKCADQIRRDTKLKTGEVDLTETEDTAAATDNELATIKMIS